LKIKDISIKRFKSLKEISLTDLGNLTIIIGANNSGKTNFLEALNLFFFGLDFNPLETDIGPIDSYFWYEKNTKESIEFNVTFTLTTDEVLELLPTENRADFKIGNVARINIHRLLKFASGNGIWSTKTAKLQTITSYNNKLVSFNNLISIPTGAK
jgi:AAA15 family ATPase/GTPase